MASAAAADIDTKKRPRDTDSPSPTRKDGGVALTYENIQGRDAMAKVLGAQPRTRDMQFVNQRTRSRGLAMTVAGDPPGFKLAVMMRQVDWLAYFPSTQDAELSPDVQMPVRMLGTQSDRLRVAILCGRLKCMLDKKTGDMYPDGRDLASQNIMKTLETPYGSVCFVHGDMWNAAGLHKQLGPEMDRLRGELDFDARTEPDPEDMPKDALDLLPVGFFAPSDAIVRATLSVAKLFDDILLEASATPSEEALRLTRRVNYCWWMARAVAFLDRGDEDALAICLAIFRAIGLFTGPIATRGLLGEIYCGLSPPRGSLMRRALLNMMGQTFFPSVYLNLADLKPETLNLNELPNAGLEWCI